MSKARPEPEEDGPIAGAHAPGPIAGAELRAPVESALGRLSDRELADRARQGDTGAFGELVRRHHPRIERLASHLLRDPAEGEDIAQEAFVRAYRAIARFDGRSEPYTWFYRITVNLSLNVLRARKARRKTSAALDDLERSLGEVARPGASDPREPMEDNLSADAAARQLYTALAAGIDELSDTLRTTLVLVCIDGRSHEEAAAILGAPEGTIAWRVHEARRKLRAYMAARGFDDEETGG